MECTTCGGMKFVELELCPRCEGTGLAIDPERDPDCWQCKGTGERGVMSSIDGGYDGTEPCCCTRPNLGSEAA